jgi:uncharacterized UPF0160 family protein
MKNLKIGVHDGRMHFDEILALAMLQVFGEYTFEVVRTRDPKVLDTCDMLVDVGMVFDGKTKFDHHHDKTLRSSAGLIFEFLKLQNKIDGLDDLVKMADEHDLGIKQAGPFELPVIISNLNTSVAAADEDFKYALDLVAKILKSMKFAQEKLLNTMDIIDEGFEIYPGVLYADANPGMFDKVLNGSTHPHIFCVVWFNSYEAKYKIQVTKKAPASFELHGKMLPQDPTMEFVHNSGFLGVSPDFNVMKSFAKKYSALCAK